MMKTIPLWALLPLAAQAQTASDACAANTGDSTPPYTLWLDQNVKVDDALGSGWMLLAPMHWTCTRSAAANAALALRPMVTVEGSDIASGATVTHAGETYRRFILQQGDARVGYVARWRSTIAGQSGAWRPVTQSVGQADDSAGSMDAAVAPNADYRVSIEVQVRMFKIDTASPAANASVNFVPLSAALTTQRRGGAAGQDVQPAQVANVTVHFKRVDQACVTPDVHVSLPPVVLTPSAAEVWRAGLAKAFALQFQHCPASLNGIDYGFQSIPRQSIANGVLPLMATATAAGVGIQVLDDSGRPLKFNTWHALTSYDPSAAAATYTVPLAARVVRTLGVIQPGRVHAAMNVTVQYR